MCYLVSTIHIILQDQFLGKTKIPNRGNLDLKLVVESINKVNNSTTDILMIAEAINK